MCADIENESDETMLFCASCGIAGVDDIKLKKCTGCHLIRYCSIKCQKDHRPKHKRACRKRAAEIRDELLFKQPESTHIGDCPICMIPLSLDMSKSTIHPCCSKEICKGCLYANLGRMKEGRLKFTCPFCRETLVRSQEESEKQRMKRVEMNDPVALREEGKAQQRKGHYEKAFEYYTKAAKLGEKEAHFLLSTLYLNGHGVEKDRQKSTYHQEEAAIGGHPGARYVLGQHESFFGNADRAVRHYVIAATQGHDRAINALTEMFKEGYVEKDDLAAALRAHKAAVDATKSPQREAEEEFQRARLARKLENTNLS